MAAIYTYQDNGSSFFKVPSLLPNVTLSFLTELMQNQGMVLVSDVTLQSRDTLQYFLTFDDVISYFYFGKGLGTMTITGSILADNSSSGAFTWNTLDAFISKLGKLRGKTIGTVTTGAKGEGYLQIGSHNFAGIISSFTLRASADPTLLHCIEFVLQVDIIDSDLPSKQVKSACASNSTN